MIAVARIKKGPAVYVLRCRDGALYVGMSTDVKARVATHNAGRGAKALRGRLPVTLVMVVRCKSASDARRLEAALKRYRRADRLRLVDGDRALLRAAKTRAQRPRTTRR